MSALPTPPLTLVPAIGADGGLAAARWTTLVLMPDIDDLADVVALERLLLNSDVRSSAAQTQELLHRDYLEYGASGRAWDRTAMIAALAADPAVSGEGVDFVPVRLAPNVILLTYRIVGEAGSLRSSVWVRESSRWQVRFHQGTRSRPPA